MSLKLHSNTGDPSNPNQVMIYSPSGQPVSLQLPTTATPGSKLTYDITYDAYGVPSATVVSAPNQQQLQQAKAFDKIAELGDEEEFATVRGGFERLASLTNIKTPTNTIFLQYQANYHPEGAEKLFETPQHLSQMRVVCPAGTWCSSV